MQRRLPIEPVPVTAWRQNVRSLLGLTAWLSFRTRFLAAGRHQCQICSSKQDLEVHEVWAYDDDHHIQRLFGMSPLCQRCHEVKHFGLAISRGRTQAALAWYCHINQCSPAEALADFRAAFAFHQTRSQHAWRLDVSWLRQFGIHLTT